MTHVLLHTLAGQTLLAYLAVFVVPVMLPAAFVKLVGLGGLRSVFSYEAADGPIHRIDPRIKLLYPFILSSTSVFLSWQAVLGLVAVSIIPWVILRPSAARVRTLLTLALSPTVALIWSQALFHPAVSASGAPIVNWPFPATISWVGTPGISLPGLVYGAEQSGRLLVSVSSSLLLVVTTSPSDVVWGFRKFRLPAQAGLAVSVALRFLPDFFTRMSVLLRAVEARGLDLSRPSWSKPWQVPGFLGRVLVAVPAVTVPLLIGALRSASTLAMVADARAFGVVPTPTTLKVHRTTQADLVAGVALGAVVVVAVALAVTGVGARLRRVRHQQWPQIADIVRGHPGSLDEVFLHRSPALVDVAQGADQRWGVGPVNPAELRLIAARCPQGRPVGLAAPLRCSLPGGQVVLEDVCLVHTEHPENQRGEDPGAVLPCCAVDQCGQPR